MIRELCLKPPRNEFQAAAEKKIRFEEAHALQQIAMTSTSPGHTNACTQIHTHEHTHVIYMRHSLNGQKIDIIRQNTHSLRCGCILYDLKRTLWL